VTLKEPQSLERATLVDFHKARSVMASDKLESTNLDDAPFLGVVPADGTAEGITDEENSEMQMWWNRTMCNEMSIPQGYQNVAVLIIRWAEELDELKAENEVSELAAR
jgi:hypothetical protein